MTQKKRKNKLAVLRSVAILPTMLTLGNMLCGFAAIFYASRELGQEASLLFGWSNLEWAAWLIFLGMVFDMLDGRVARLTNQTSKLGAQLDSLADVVTFGVAPAFLLVQLVEGDSRGVPFLGPDNLDTLYHRFVFIIAMCYVACAGLRLARFNVESTEPDESNHMSFKGLPSPGAGGTIASLIIFQQWLYRGSSEQGNQLTRLLNIDSLPLWLSSTATMLLLFFSLLVALAMVSNLPYVHAANRYLRGRAPFHIVVFGVIALILMALNFQLAIVLAFSLYALSAPVVSLLHAMKLPIPHAIDPDATFDDSEFLEEDLIEISEETATLGQLEAVKDADAASASAPPSPTQPKPS